MCECGGLGLLWGNGAEVGSGKAGGVGEQVGVQAVVYRGASGWGRGGMRRPGVWGRYARKVSDGNKGEWSACMGSLFLCVQIGDLMLGGFGVCKESFRMSV